MPGARHPHGVPITRQGRQRGNVTGVVLRCPQTVRGNCQRREPHPFRVWCAMTVPIKSRMVHQNGEPTADQEQQKEEVHKVGQSEPRGKTVRNRRLCRIDRRQEGLRWKPDAQVLHPRNRDRGENDNRKRQNEPMIYPDTKTPIRRIVDGLVELWSNACMKKVFMSLASGIMIAMGSSPQLQTFLPHLTPEASSPFPNCTPSLSFLRHVELIQRDVTPVPQPN